MPECRDLQTGVIGYYEFIEVPTVKEVRAFYNASEPVSVLLAVVLSSLTTCVILFGRRRFGRV